MRWNGHAPHTATGEARVSDSHCQLRNCAAGTIASTTTGTASAADTSSRRRSKAASSRSGADPPASSSPRPAGEQAGPPCSRPSTTAISSSVPILAGKLTRARSVA